MCEQVLEQSPGYFRKFAKHFRYTISEKYPDLPVDNFALAFHNTKSDACHIGNNKHWHLLVYSDNFVNNSGYIVPCPFACFTLLILDGVNIQHTGDIFDKLKAAANYNQKYSTDESAVNVLRKKLPKILPMVSKKHQSSQTDMLPSASLQRYLSVINGPYGGVFSQIIDAFISGYGTVHRQHHSMVTNFELTCSDAQCYCYECTE